MRIVVTGGAGFVGSHLALSFKRETPNSTVIALDNLKRRGSELALQRLAAEGVEFRHGDIRNREDFADLGRFDLLVECSAEPSVQAGLRWGALPHQLDPRWRNQLPRPRPPPRRGGDFLSTTRAYPIARLRELPLVPTKTRFVIPAPSTGPGWSARGIDESFPLAGSRSL